MPNPLTRLLNTPLPRLLTPSTKDATTRRYSAAPTYTSPGQPLRPYHRLTPDRAINDAWDRVLWVYRAVDSRSKNLARLPITVTDGRGPDAPVIPDHPVARLLNTHPNPQESAYDFRYRLHTLLDVSVSTGVPVEVTEDRNGPVALQILNPLHTHPIPDPDVFLAGWEMRLPDGTRFGPEDGLTPYRPGEGGVLWFKRAHPTDPYQSHSWLTAAGIDIDLSWYAKVFGRNFLLNDGRPGGVLVLKQPGGVTPDVMDTIKGRIRPGPMHAGRVEVLEADDAEFIDLAATPRDAQYVTLHGMTKMDILAAAGVPESVFNASGRTFANADAELEGWWLQDLVPEADAVAQVLDWLTGDPYDDAEVVSYAWDAVPVLQRHRRERAVEVLDRLGRGVVTIDEAREAVGLEALGLPGTRVLWLPAGRAPVGSDEDVAALLGQGQVAPEELPPAPFEGPDTTVEQLSADGGDPEPVTGGTPPAAITARDADEDQSIGEPAGGTKTGHARSLVWKASDPLPGVPRDYLARVRADAWRLADTHEGLVADALRAVYDAQEQVVLARLRGQKARRGTRHWDGLTRLPTKTLDPAYVLDRARWAAEVTTAVTGLVIDAVVAAAGATWAQVRLPTPTQPIPPDTADTLAATTVRLIVDGFDARAGKLQDVIAAADDAGATLGEITETVQAAYLSADTWADTQSRAVVGAMNAARHVTAVNVGAVERRWVATEDPRTRPSHAAAEGQVRGMNEPFTVGEAQLMFPGDPFGPPGEVIACRCVMLLRLPEQNENTMLGDLADLDAYEAGWKTADHVPPQAVRDAARRGLELRAAQSPSNRGGTPVGVARARDLARGAAVSDDTIRRMVSFFARHEVDKQAPGWSSGSTGYPSKGLQAWLLWGGDPGRAWAGKVKRSLDAGKTLTPRVSFDPAAHDVDTKGRFPTPPRVVLPDGRSGTATSVTPTGTVSVALPTGRVFVPTDTLTTHPEGAP